ncbi:MAG: hypothetical protein ABJO75_00555 [Sedimentitalea sp.]|uniref:RcgA family putative transporter n=1 Tax=Sedimentitalea sp. TaxID=2048915 RepID=UPI003263FB4A
MIKNGKYFVAPQQSSDTFKVLFARLAAEGAGRPVDRQGFPDGPWTPETIAEAISAIDGYDGDIDLRTVQIWFQDNDNGISTNNIRWLARIFGCNDPDATSLWQVELSAANRRLAEKRKRKKVGNRPRLGSTETVQKIEAGYTRARASAVTAQEINWRFNLAKKTEALFDSQSSMALPLVVFTGACTLALISFTLNVHSVVFTPENGPPRQVGFLWAPNWTITFLAVLPLFLVLLMDLLRCWKEEWRTRLADFNDPEFLGVSWEHRLTAASYAFWATFFVTVIVASGYNWTATHLTPLLESDPGNWAVDWSRIAILRPDLISVPSAIAFTSLVFLYNGFTAYLFFTGHIILHLMKDDYVSLMKGLEAQSSEEFIPEIENISFLLMNGIFRCTALGVLITILMKLQSSFLQSNSTNIIDWLVADFGSPFGNHDSIAKESTLSRIAPGSFYSFFCLLAIVGTFANASIKIRWMFARLHLAEWHNRLIAPWVVMNGTMALLVISYFLIGVLPGFTIFLAFSLALTGYLLTKPASMWSRDSRKERST